MNSLLETIPEANVISTNIISSFDEICFPTRVESLGFIDENGEYQDAGRTAFIDARDNKALYVGNEYKPTLNVELYQSVLPLLSNGYELEDVRNYSNRKFEINLANQNYKININGLDAALRLKITNSYDGSTRLSMRFGAYIQVCGNGLCIGNFFDVKRKHTQSNDLSNMLTGIANTNAPLVARFLNEYKLTDDTDVVRLFKVLTAGMPDVKDKEGNVLRQAKGKIMLNDSYIKHTHTYPPPMALLMAATDLSTHGYKYGLSVTDQQKLEEAIPQTFFGKN